MYITSLSADGCEHYLTISFSSRPACMYLNFTTSQLKMPNWFTYFVIKQAFEYENKGI